MNAQAAGEWLRKKAREASGIPSNKQGVNPWLMEALKSQGFETVPSQISTLFKFGLNTSMLTNNDMLTAFANILDVSKQELLAKHGIVVEDDEILNSLPTEIHQFLVSAKEVYEDGKVERLRLALAAANAILEFENE